MYSFKVDVEYTLKYPSHIKKKFTTNTLEGCYTSLSILKSFLSYMGRKPLFLGLCLADSHLPLNHGLGYLFHEPPECSSDDQDCGHLG